MDKSVKLYYWRAEKDKVKLVYEDNTIVYVSKTDFDRAFGCIMSINYRKKTVKQIIGDNGEETEILLPDFADEEITASLGVWALRRKKYLMENEFISYHVMFFNGTLLEHLTETDKEAEAMFSRLINEMAKAEGVTERLKEENQLEWVGRMNSIRNRATEIVNAELIFG